MESDAVRGMNEMYSIYDARAHTHTHKLTRAQTS